MNLRQLVTTDSHSRSIVNAKTHNLFRGIHQINGLDIKNYLAMLMPEYFQKLSEYEVFSTIITRDKRANAVYFD